MVQAHAPPGEQRDAYPQRRGAKASELDEQHYDYPPEHRKRLSRVNHDKSGNAGGAGGSKKRLQRAHIHSRLV